MPALFISDLHLTEERPEANERFISFLEEKARDAEALYILGDFFEYWIGDDDLAEPFNAVIAGLLARPYAPRRAGLPHARQPRFPHRRALLRRDRRHAARGPDVVETSRAKKPCWCTATRCAPTTSTTRPGGARRAIPPSRRSSWRSRSPSAAARSADAREEQAGGAGKDRRDHGRQRRRGARGAAPPRRAPPDPRPHPPPRAATRSRSTASAASAGCCPTGTAAAATSRSAAAGRGWCVSSGTCACSAGGEAMLLARNPPCQQPEPSTRAAAVDR